jgi:hypothetical protein
MAETSAARATAGTGSARDDVKEKVKMMPEDVYANMKAQQANEVNTDCCNQAVAGNGSYRCPTLQEEAEKQSIHHSKMANKCTQAAVFLSANPAFDEFVRLVRAGVIQF